MDKEDKLVENLSFKYAFQFSEEYLGLFNSIEVLSPTEIMATQWRTSSDSLSGRREGLWGFLGTYINQIIRK